MTLHLPSRMISDLHQRAENSRPYECCGFIAGKDSVGLGLVRLLNHAADPKVFFFVEPFDQYRAEMEIAKRGWDQIAIYHSHPTGNACPSRSDRVFAAARPELMVIVGQDEMRCWRVDTDLVVHEVEIQVQEAVAA